MILIEAIHMKGERDKKRERLSGGTSGDRYAKAEHSCGDERRAMS